MKIVLVCAGVLFLFLVVLVVIGSLAEQSGTSGNLHTQQEIDAFLISRNFVKDHMRTPRQVDFPNSGDEGVHVAKVGDSSYLVRAWFEAPNAFGQVVRSRYNCIVVPKGGNNWQLAMIEIQ